LTSVLDRLEPLVTEPAAYVFVVVLGLLWGSFANVCIYRWPPSPEFPQGRSVVAPGSHCFACQAPIAWYDNVPILAWLWLRGRCRACGAGFSSRYLIVEALTGALFGVAWWAAVIAPRWFEPFDVRLGHFAVYAAFCFVMVVITFIDLDHQLILNKLTIPSIAIFYAASFLWSDRHWYDGVVGAAVGYGLPWAIGEVYYRITRHEGMGLGDGMLLALVGALLGWPGVLVALFGGSVVGTVIMVTALLTGRGGGPIEPDADESVAAQAAAPGAPASEAATAAAEGDEPPSAMRTPIPFGPFLAIAAMFYLFAEPWLHLQFHLPGG
jgi:leader peptidase (prepilin peptidase)/N-methyltransferase